MIKIVKHITLDVATENIFQNIIAKQLDTDSRFLNVQLTNEGTPLNIPTTSTVIINAKRPDKKSDSFRGEVETNGTVTVPIANWMIELDGEVKCDISVIDSDGRKISTTSFTIKVDPSANPDGDISSDVTPGLSRKTSITLVDSTTGKDYNITVVNGKLTVVEV